MIRQEVLHAVLDPKAVHFKQFWLSSVDRDESELLEVLCFGNYGDLNAIQSCEEWKDAIESKLRTLTLLGLCEVPSELEYDQAMASCCIPDDVILEQRMVELQAQVHFQLDSVGRRIKVLRCLGARDIYNGERPLLLLRDAARSRESTLAGLRQWKQKLQYQLR
ncbi:AGL136Cp [Eremothecium gossypii ATCC 10895]|uniref:COP9 signalosome complex subunit 9 n=1 Tax=Eremothecium gossypii (strain ATCC 10895 / CBS 109.51 / FGSC 9923 / NRRL Y-1056) TaxID=284811 RepID=CSN9_EREGS|nr:AGL136Cp [Eremothecium gossypii ATCC 10895]Q750S5.1 RecName: Full=COP9 signalosome complex subunit 9 [Eremothecium gossypii ATCC 10895]AAS54355.1 AGL136Cp [Eremothecium gossypii ATCC 10895]AEY98682.1 FAGL136Cp [Eremothecium gossypii FDAG1]